MKKRGCFPVGCRIMVAKFQLFCLKVGRSGVGLCRTFRDDALFQDVKDFFSFCFFLFFSFFFFFFFLFRSVFFFVLFFWIPSSHHKGRFWNLVDSRREW
jgi:hypothetical protein